MTVLELEKILETIKNKEMSVVYGYEKNIGWWDIDRKPEIVTDDMGTEMLNFSVLF